MVQAGFKDSSSFIQTVTNAHIWLNINNFENNNEHTNIFTKDMKALKKESMEELFTEEGDRLDNQSSWLFL